MASPRLKVLAFTAVLALGLAACGDGSETTQTAPPSINISAPSDGGGESSPSDGGGGETSEAAPEIPAPDPADYPGMDQETPEGAEQAYRYYWAVTFWGYQSGQTAELQAMQGDQCESCAEDVESISDMSEGEYWSETSLEDVKLERLEDEGDALVFSYEFVASSHSELDADTGQRFDEEKRNYLTVGGLAWQNDQWVIVGFAIEAVDDV